MTPAAFHAKLEAALKEWRGELKVRRAIALKLTREKVSWWGNTVMSTTGPIIYYSAALLDEPFCEAEEMIVHELLHLLDRPGDAIVEKLCKENRMVRKVLGEHTRWEKVVDDRVDKVAVALLRLKNNGGE